jgi:Tfp pilus assembly protein PilN
MAISIAAQVAKKMPVPGTDFASRQASITITAEVTDLAQVSTQAQRLYALAEQAVDAQLGITTTAPTPAPTPSAITGPSTYAPRPSQGHASPSRSRRLAPVTDSQLRLIDKLVQDTGTDPQAVLRHHRIQAMRELTCKDASALIDELKQRVPR